MASATYKNRQPVLNSKCVAGCVVISTPSTRLRVNSVRNPCFEQSEESFLDPSHPFGMTTHSLGNCYTVSDGRG
jgi:hypothetical protein